MNGRTDDRADSGHRRSLRLVAGGRAEIEREILNLLAQVEFNEERFGCLLRKLDRSPNATLSLVSVSKAT